MAGHKYKSVAGDDSLLVAASIAGLLVGAFVPFVLSLLASNRHLQIVHLRCTQALEVQSSLVALSAAAQPACGESSPSVLSVLCALLSVVLVVVDEWLSCAAFALSGLIAQ